MIIVAERSAQTVPPRIRSALLVWLRQLQQRVLPRVPRSARAYFPLLKQYLDRMIRLAVVVVLRAVILC